MSKTNVKIIKPYLKASVDQVSLAGSLAKEGKTRIPGASIAIQPMRDSKQRVITGLDENALSINRLNDPDIERARIKGERERLEALMNEDLRPESKFWTDVENGVGNTLYYLKDDDNVFDMNNPMDVINFNWIVNLPIVAKSYEEIESGKLDPSNISFYVYETDIQTTREFDRRKKINNVVAKLNDLGENEIKKVAFLLNLGVHDTATYEQVYNTIDKYLHQEKKYSGADPINEFEKVANYSPQVLNIKVLVQQLINERVIRRSGESLFEGESLVAKSTADFELQLAEDTEKYVLYDEKMRTKRAYVNSL